MPYSPFEKGERGFVVPAKPARDSCITRIKAYQFGAFAAAASAPDQESIRVSEVLAHSVYLPDQRTSKDEPDNYIDSSGPTARFKGFKMNRMIKPAQEATAAIMRKKTSLPILSQ
jgi:hypothetical protein